jgi:hypothetical protein
MAEDSRPPRPDKQSEALPRRVPGTGGLTPAQVRRGFLAPATSQPTDAKDKPDAADTDVRSDHPRAPRLPRRVPGNSAIQRPPPADQPASPGEPGTPAADSTPPTSARVSPEQIAASAARLLRPKTVMPKVGARSRNVASSAQTARGAASAPAAADASTSGQPPPSASTQATAPSPARPPRSAPAPASTRAKAKPPARGKRNAKRTSPAGPAARPGQLDRRRSSRRARRWQLVGLLVVIAAVLAAVLAVALARHQGPPGSGASVSASLVRRSV